MKTYVLMRERNASQRRLIYTQKQMSNNKINTDKIILGVIYYFMSSSLLIESFDTSISISSKGLRIYEILYDNIKHAIPGMGPF